MGWLLKQFRFFFLLFLCAHPVLLGCEGSERRGQIDNTVKELSGQKSLDRMDKIKTDIGKIENQQKDRMEQIAESVGK
jgi:hypothetical protein